MAKVPYNIRLTGDGHIEVKVKGHNPEYISLLYKERGQIYDGVKTALRSKDVPISDEHLTEVLYNMIWRHV